MIDVWRLLWPYLRKHQRLLLIAVAAMGGEVLTGLAAPWPLKFVFDGVLLTHSGGKTRLRARFDLVSLLILVGILVASLLIAGLDAYLTYVDDQTTTVAAQRSVDELRRAIFAHLQRLSLSFHANVETQLGDLLSRLNGDIQALQDLAAGGISNLVTNGLGIITALGVMAWLDWRLALTALAFTVPMYIVAQKTMTGMRLAMRTARHQEGRVGAMLSEALGAVKLVQAFGREQFEEERLAGESSKSLEANLEAAKLQARIGPVLSGLSAAATAAVTLYGALLVVDRSITAGELLVFLTYLRGMQSPIRQLSKLSFALGKATAGAERLQEVLANQPSVRERPHALTAGRVSGAIHFEGVTFGYRPGHAVVRDLTLDVTPGQVVALVGATGAGKSTLVGLLPRFYDPWDGRVLLDGQDVAELTLSSLRANIALVLQDSLIFRASLADNIAYGDPHATYDRIVAAAEATGADIIARRLPDGYDTLVSERGASLSGGEKQCIGIARAMLKDAPVVVLDEPTSSMDALTERRVMAGITRLLAGRTALVIAHRLTTVRNADLVAVLEEGRLVQLGPPADLLADQNGQFATLARTQSLFLSSIEPELHLRPERGSSVEGHF
jgi:ATP-binding cassette subfamily B protein/subfamily B ATP-binding cassette protein MsbA